MTMYQVHFEMVVKSMVWVQRRYVVTRANSEAAAIDKVKRALPTSYGHWVNRLANEAA